MHAMHARLPVNFVLEERLERYADAIEKQPAVYRGCWTRACWPLGKSGNGFDEVRVDLGCGKGAFIVESARREPNVLFVGIDAEPLCMAYAAQRIMEADLRNAVVVPLQGDALQRIFAPGEVSTIHLNFPTPYPRKRDAARRLVSLERLIEYREVLANSGTLRLRTDSQPLRDFALTQLDLAGYRIVHSSEDERAEHPDEPSSEYEERLCAAGAHVLALWASPANKPVCSEQTASLSLVDYLPEDLFEGRYVPHGMEQTIVNLRRQKERAARGGRA